MTALGDVIIDSLEEFLRKLFGPISEVIELHASEIVKIAVSTPHPNTVFNPPTNDPWPALYSYYWDRWIPIMLFLWAAMIGLVIFFESTSHLFGSYHRSKLKRRAFTGLLGILSWWWIAAFSLQFVDSFTGVILPQLSEITLFETLSFGAMGVLGIVVAFSVDLLLFILVGLIYVMRQVVLYLFVLLMPVLIVLWIPGVGPFALASKFMRRLAGFYVPFLFMTVPVAVLFRLGELLGASFGLSASGFVAWLVALVIPLVAVVSPFVLFWQAGALFFLADRLASHASRRRARSRIQSMRSGGQRARQGGRNFARGLRGTPAVRSNGQTTFGSGSSRAHAVGSRLRSSGTRLRQSFTTHNNGGGRGGGGRGGTEASGQTTTHSNDGGRGDDDDIAGNRAENFEVLRRRVESASPSRSRSQSEDSGASGDDTDDRPYYIQ